MALECEDLAGYGVVLIPPTSQTYFDLLADIERRLQARTKGAPPVWNDALSRIAEHDTSGSAILLNRARVAIASIAYTWSFRGPNGRITTGSSSPGTNPSVLLPFTQMDRVKKFDAYWNTIFPGSKRLMMADAGTYGDNTDVRPPAADEPSSGGFAGGFGGGGRRGAREVLKLTLDGVFFVDGGFAGPNQLGSWDQVVAAREAYLTFADLARQAGDSSAAQGDFFAYAAAQRPHGQRASQGAPSAASTAASAALWHGSRGDPHLSATERCRDGAQDAGRAGRQRDNRGHRRVAERAWPGAAQAMTAIGRSETCPTGLE